MEKSMSVLGLCQSLYNDKGCLSGKGRLIQGEHIDNQEPQCEPDSQGYIKTVITFHCGADSEWVLQEELMPLIWEQSRPVEQV